MTLKHLDGIEREMAILTRLFDAVSEGEHPQPTTATTISQQLCRLRSQHTELSIQLGQTMSMTDLTLLGRRLCDAITDILSARAGWEDVIDDIVSAITQAITEPAPDTIPLRRTA